MNLLAQWNKLVYSSSMTHKEKMGKSVRDSLVKYDVANQDLTKEVLNHIYAGILAIPEFALGDGTKARLAPYTKPRIGEDGAVQCNFEVLLQSSAQSSHLEFSVNNAGWASRAKPNLHSKRIRREEYCRK